MKNAGGSHSDLSLQKPSLEVNTGSTDVAQNPQDTAPNSSSNSPGDVLPQSPLQIIIIQPADGQTVTSHEVTIIGKTAPAAVVTADDEITIADQAGNFKIQLTLDTGLQLVQIEASNSLGEDTIVELNIDVEPE